MKADLAPGAVAEALDDVAGARRRVHPVRWAAGIVMAVLLAQLAVFMVTDPAFEWDVVADHLFSASVFKGLGVSVLLAVVAMVIGSLLGVCLAAAALSGFAPARWLATAYNTVFRGIPPLVQLLFWFNLAYLLPELSLGIPFGPSFLYWQTNSVITPLVAAIVALSLHEGGYMAEIVRGGLLSVPAGQRDAARATGFTPPQTFFRITLPQAMRFIVPPTGSQFISVLKGSSLVSVIAISDLLHSVQAVYSRTYEVVPLLLVACIWYLAVVTVLSAGQRRLERHFGRGAA
ncbi:amino acid ABC transporter permease [Actinomadura sp. CNU-125]|uniref:amino acid ABC transporter permease n=1 Tax=Actinomadura sp. CNU-125 TaxID=1904961 RepID=UPI0021CD1535|nr:amino acid ABC transporter permease [Actinomadura sp. CNU-125]